MTLETDCVTASVCQLRQNVSLTVCVCPYSMGPMCRPWTTRDTTPSGSPAAQDPSNASSCFTTKAAPTTPRYHGNGAVWPAARVAMTCLTGYQQASSSDSEYVSTSSAVDTGNPAGLAGYLSRVKNQLDVENIFWVEKPLGFELK